MYPLDNSVKPYAWGDLTAIPRLLNVAPTSKPAAELWLGAHPSDASRRSTDGEPLDALIAKNPKAVLGPNTYNRFGEQLPFLLKVLAAAKPLSLQAHPSRAQAQAGYDHENDQGIALDDPARNYKDTNHKPELICALTAFHALCGFRTVADSIHLFRSLALPTETLERAGLKAYFREVMTASAFEKHALATRAAEALNAAVATKDRWTRERHWALELARQYPGDIGLIGAMLLNVMTLQPGQALYLPAGNLHAYLQGTGIELMASSDNVLRGGLTPKHVDVDELLAVLDFTAGPVAVVEPHRIGPELAYRTPATDFELSKVFLSPHSGGFRLERRGPEILLVVSGRVRVGSATQTLDLAQGQSAFVGYDEGDITLWGDGELFRATVGR